MQALKSFFKALNNEEDTFESSLKTDVMGLLLRCSINELDWYYYNYTKAEEPTMDQHEQYYILLLGTARLLKLSLECHDTFTVPVVTTKRNRELSLRVLNIASGLGIIQHGRRVAQSVESGLGRIEQIGSHEFVITLPEDVEDCTPSAPVGQNSLIA